MRPTSEEGDFEASFIKGSLTGAKAFASFTIEVGAEESMRPIWGFKVGLSSIVSAEENESVVINFEFFKEGDDLSQLSVDHVHEGCIDPCIALRSLASLPGFVLEELPRRMVLIDPPEPVWRGPWEVAEEGPVVVLFDEA